MNIGILGAGVSGLSMAQLLKNNSNVEILEQKELPGGIARTKNINGIPYHMVGGHCFNSKYKDVLEFVFNQILPFDQWRKVKRKSRIQFHGHEIDYPIEFAMKQIYEIDKDLALKIAGDFLITHDDQNYRNLEDWFIKKFGKTLSEEYFIPYNTKIWNNEPSKMNHLWVEDKLPIPNKYDFFESLFNNTKDTMSHAEFYYPVSNDQNTFIAALTKDIDITYNYKVNTIKFDEEKNKWIINNDKQYDILISTLPLKEMPFLLENTPDKVKSAGDKLKYNKISNILWRNKLTDKTWTYIPDKNSIFHRYIHIGAYLNPLHPYSISEAVGEHSFEEMKEYGIKDSFLEEPIDYNISDYAYVVFDENYEHATGLIKDYLGEKNLHMLGRFGEWQYYNMDVCIKKAIDLKKSLFNA